MKLKSDYQIYYPHSDILLVQINWDSTGGFYCIPLKVQEKLIEKIGRTKYIKLPERGTNPRGVEIAKEALSNLVEDKDSRRIIINWKKTKIEFNPFKRWVDLWREG
ncbi:MAG: ThaI family type II restriction endonuclease [bacterium]